MSPDPRMGAKCFDIMDGTGWTSLSTPSDRISLESKWLGLSAIEAFFSWTEHVFIHIGILNGTLTSAGEVTDAAESNWNEKFRLAFNIKESYSKKMYDKLGIIRREFRNFVSHGSFGKQGEAFHFHSSAGAVPVRLPLKKGSKQFSFAELSPFDIQNSLECIDNFIEYLWEGPRAPAKIYIQKYELPLIITMACDGTYEQAMASVEEMESFANCLSDRMDQAANMDW